MHVPWRKRLSREIRGRLRARALAKHGIGIVAATRNGLMAVDPRDFAISRSLLTHGAYDFEAVEWLAPLLDRNSHIVFAGAHIGTLLVPLAVRSGSRHIVAFEPSTDNHRFLRMNVALNGLADVIVHDLAVGDAPGTIRFQQNRINSGNSRAAPQGELEVGITTLDAALPADWPRVDLLVMDVEGFEVRAMRGGAKSLAKTARFYIEYAPEQLLEQGSRPEEFLELAASHFQSLYLPGKQVRFFPSKSYVRHLQELGQRRGLLLNLLFSNDAEPDARLMGCVGGASASGI